jgi:alpha-tubulin suppressor-like RCC1 family protein
MRSTVHVLLALLVACGSADYSTEGNSEAYGAGWNERGQLGDGTTTDRHTPVRVASGLTGISQVAGGNSHSLFLLANGEAYGAGENNYGRLGDGTGTDRHTPVRVASGLANISQVAAGNYHSLFLLANGEAYGAGWNERGRLGDGTWTNRHTPVRVASGLTGISQVAGGGSHSLFLLANGEAYGAGQNRYGELGDGTTTDRHTPVRVASGLTGISQVAGGGSHSLFLLANGEAYGAGSNYDGQLGDGTTTDRHTPVRVASGLKGISQVAGGGSHSLFLLANGEAYGAGQNTRGQLGDGTTTERHTPVRVASGLTNISQVAAGGDHSLFLLANGEAYGAGWNRYGQLGDGTTTARYTPVRVASGLTGISQVAAGNARSLFLAAGMYEEDVRTSETSAARTTPPVLSAFLSALALALALASS